MIACDTNDRAMNSMVSIIVIEIIATLLLESIHEAQHLFEGGCFSGLVWTFYDGKFCLGRKFEGGVIERADGFEIDCIETHNVSLR